MTTAELRQKLGNRRYRVALLRFGHRMTVRQIARRMRLRRQTVAEHLRSVTERYPSLVETLGGRHRVWRDSDLPPLLAA